MPGSAIGERMKRYEVQSVGHILPKVPVIIRVDGRAFHKFCKHMQRPFDRTFMQAMVDAAGALAQDMQGFKLGYVQSDEASFLLTDYDNFNTQGWFGYDVFKLVSIAASAMSVSLLDSLQGYKYAYMTAGELPVFDARAFNVPREDVANYFLWRAKDWKRNSLQMLCRSYFSCADLHGKSTANMHEMLHEVGMNWATDLDDMCRNGTFIYKSKLHDSDPVTVMGFDDAIRPVYADIAKLVDPFIVDRNTPKVVDNVEEEST